MINKNKIRVYLQYPWKFPDSPYYKYLIKESPPGIEYLNMNKQAGVITKKNKFLFSNFIKEEIRKFFRKIKFTIPNSHFIHKKNFDVAHCCHCLLKNNDIPWVFDIESFWQLYIGNYNPRVKRKIKKIITSDNCKKILPWNNHIKDKLAKEFPNIKDKLEVVYPSVSPKNTKIRCDDGKINLVFSGRYFYGKGGLVALEVIDILTKKYDNVYAYFNSDTPPEIMKKYSKNTKISFYGLIPQKKLFDIYSNSDILIYPGYSDTFGFAFLEAMSFALPIITLDGICRKEIVEDGKTGFVIERAGKINFKEIDSNMAQDIKNMVEKASLLIEDKKIRKKMAHNCLNEISFGKFSRKERNKKLKRIYNDAIK